jgi:DNA-binding transcriptional regulator/RsmH inhibitor MraZ
MKRMPERDDGRGDQAATPQSLARKLAGLGASPLQLDGCRITAPAPFLHAVGSLARADWWITPWADRRIHIIADAVWDAYLAGLRSSVPAAIADPAVRSFQQVSVRRKLDRKRRWNIPTDFLRHAGLVSGKNAVVLVPNEFWVELVSLENWERQFAESLHTAMQAISTPGSKDALHR